MPQVFIENRAIGPDHPPYVIAEAGINHNGEVEKALEMIAAAKAAGADAIKFQTFKAEEFVGDPNQTYTYRSQGKEVTESMLGMFRRCELPREAWVQIKAECRRQGITFLSTPQNRSDLDLLLEIGIAAIKIGSDDFTNLPLLKSYAGTGLPLILSCGMADLAEVYQALETVGALDGYPTILLLCTSQYPTPPQDANLRKLRALQAAFPTVVTGFSDHTQGALASSLAVALGACLFEKHFTLDHDLPGPDHWFAENPGELAQWVSGIRKSYVMLGDAVVRPTPAEREMRLIARRSVVALQAIGVGDAITDAVVGLRRPGGGIPPVQLAKVLGRKARNTIPAGKLIDWTDLL